MIAATVTAQNKWKIDKSHSNINFSVSHLVVSEVTGKFKDFSGTVESMKDDFSDMKLDIAIRANSVDTDEPKRDGHLKSPDFFNAAVDSIVTFKSTKVEKNGEGKYKVIGDLTMRGITKQVVLDAYLKGKTKNPWGQTVAIFKSNTTINRTEWGLKWNKGLEAGGLLVGENVDLTFNVEFVQG
ncbi:MAG TPA: polyisoprenoid-binding protein [Bacteroidetes bacterium]|nr:polyisoprenoid-binding protein [Bacteroidota bacterium]